MDFQQAGLSQGHQCRAVFGQQRGRRDAGRKRRGGDDELAGMDESECSPLGVEHPVPCQLFKRHEREQRLRERENDARWNLQKQRNEQQDALFRRWGATLDSMQSKIVEQGHVSESFLALMQAQREESEKSSALLEELTVGLRQTNERAVQNHQSLMTALSSAFGISTGATARADRAHSEAEQAAGEAREAAEQARRAAEEAGKLAVDRTVLTRGALLAWGVGLSGLAAVGAKLVADHGWPAIRGWIDQWFG